MKILTKKAKRKLNQWINIFERNIMFSLNSGASIMGFILGQFVWIWILRGFIGYFALWFIEITKSNTLTVFSLTKLFWIFYGFWFFINILYRLGFRIKEGAEK